MRRRVHKRPEPPNAAMDREVAAQRRVLGALMGECKIPRGSVAAYMQLCRAASLRLASAAGFLWSMLAASGCLSARPAFAADEQRPRVLIRVTPAIAIAPAVVRLSGRVVDEGQALHCPAIEVLWGDGCRSSRQSDCDPYAPQDERPTVHAVDPPVHRFYQGGDYTVEVRAKDGDKVRASASARLVIVGPEPMSDVGRSEVGR